MKEKLKEILISKSENKVAQNMLEIFDYFTDEEIVDIYTLIWENDPIKKKDILLRHMDEYEQTIWEIVKLWMHFERMKTIMMYEWIRKQSKESLLNLKESINLKTNMEV